MIETQSLAKFYGSTRGVENLSLKVEKGEVFGLLGPNGAGKTTTIRLLMGLMKPNSGSATVNDLDCWKQSVEVNQISAYIPGDVHLYKNETGQSLINLYGGIRKNKKLAKNLVERLDLDASKKVKNLSKGNRQKLAIVLALMFEPLVLILDEPTSGLDPLMQQEFYKIIKEFKDKGATVFISSHFLPEVEKMCEKVAILKEGSLVAVEEVDKLAKKHVSDLNVTFEAKPDLTKYKIPQITKITHVLNNHYQMKIKGEIDPVIKALSKDKIKDLSFEHATLEEIFLEHYS